MKFLDRFILVIYSIVMFLLSVLTAVLLFRWLDIETVHTFVDEILFTEPYSSIVLGVVILCSSRIIFHIPGWATAD